MAIVKVHLCKGECVHSVKERLAKALADDEIMEANERYNDELMEDLMTEAEAYYAKQYLSMIREIMGILESDLI